MNADFQDSNGRFIAGPNLIFFCAHLRKSASYFDFWRMEK